MERQPLVTQLYQECHLIVPMSTLTTISTLITGDKNFGVTVVIKIGILPTLLLLAMIAVVEKFSMFGHNKQAPLE